MDKSADNMGGYYKDIPFLSEISTDAYTKKPFSYSAQADNYTLVYQIKLPVYTPKTNPSLYYDYASFLDKELPIEKNPRLKMNFIEGINTANKTALSKEAITASVTDTDKDGLPNTLEKIFGTNPNKADTDGDAFSDFKEITTGSNPLGTGKLDLSY